MTSANEWKQLLEEEHKIKSEIWQKYQLKFDTEFLRIPYFSSSGELLFEKKRREPSYTGPNKYLYPSGSHITLYPSTDLSSSEKWIVTEGELDTLTLKSYGFPAVTAGGVTSFNKELANYFTSKIVYICYDNDARGKEGAEKVAQILLEAGVDVKIVDLPVMDQGKDIGDYFKLGHTREQFIELLKAARETGTDNQEESLINADQILWPAPLAEEAFYGLAGQIIRTIEPHTEADPAALLMNFLTGFGSMIGDKAYFLVEGDKHPGRLFIVLVGQTAKARKGTSWGHLKNLFSKIDEVWVNNIQSGLSSGEGLVWAVRDPIEKPSDPGVEDKRLLVLEGEFARTLKVMERDGNTLSPLIRLAWDHGNLRILTKNAPAKATGAHISIIGHITIEELNRYLNTTEALNGFGNRFLWCCVKRSQFLPHGGNISAMALDPLINKLRAIISFSQNAEEVTWADETVPLWDYIYRELSESETGFVGSMTARSEAYVVRLTVIYALLDKSKVIKPDHLKAALAVWDYCEASIRYIFRDKAGDSHTNQIIEALINHPEGMTRTDIYNHFGRHIESGQLLVSLESLVKAGRIKKEVIKTEGRDKSLFTLNTLNAPHQGKTYLQKLEDYLATNNLNSTCVKSAESLLSPTPKEPEISINMIPGLEGYGD